MTFNPYAKPWLRRNLWEGCRAEVLGMWEASGARAWRNQTAAQAGSDDAQPPPSDAPRNEEIRRIEAVLLLAREPLPVRKIAQLAGLESGTLVRALVRRLNRLYDEEGCAFRVVEVGGGLQLRTRSVFAPWLSRRYREPIELRLSPPALETLAVVAYKQPVLRAELESIRGVQCGEILRQLMDRGLVRIVGRSEELGRPYLYGTTARFLEVFGLRGLDDLPYPEYRCSSVSKRSTTVSSGGKADKSEEGFADEE
ncbi:SMC-Scp complex subunit ScpB [Thermopirellula anaerolimosa]